MNFQRFQGTLIGWRELFDQAAEFATTLGPVRLHSISHSASDGRGIVTVWYRDEVAGPEVEAAIPLAMRFFYKRGTMISWDELFRAVADEAAGLQREQVVSFSHSDSKGDGIAVLWYWGPPEV